MQNAAAVSATNAGETEAPSDRARRTSSTPAAAAAIPARTSVAHGGRNSTVPPTPMMSTAALTRREIDTRSSALCRADRLRMDGAVSAVALLIIHDGFEQIPRAKIRPERVSHPDLRIRNLPQQKIADAHLPAGADEQVRIGLAGGVKK